LQRQARELTDPGGGVVEEISSIRFLRDFVVVPSKAARTARVSGSVRY